MKGDGSARASLGERALDELKEFLIIAAYLFLCFATVAYLKAAILQAHGIRFAPFSFALAKSLICAKFVSVGDFLHLGERFKSRAPIWSILYKSLCFLALLVLLNAVEDAVVGFLQGRSVVNSLAHFGGGTRDQIIAESFIIFWVLVPLFAVQALAEIIGRKTLLDMFLRRPDSAP